MSLREVRASRRRDELDPGPVFGPCDFCGGDATTRHHTIPRPYRGTDPVEIIPLCRMCHMWLHQRFTNADLALRLNSRAALRDEPDIVTWISWTDYRRRTAVYGNVTKVSRKLKP